MIFHWDSENLDHIARHAVSPSQAEAALGADDAVFRQDEARPNRLVVEATLEGRTLRIAFARAFPEGIRIITADWISSKRRSKS